MTDDERKAYQRGYYAGTAKAWPAHRPLSPPDEVIGPIVRHAQRLRDIADSYCATVGDEDDDLAPRFSVAIDDFDEAMTRFGEWLRG